MPSTYVAYIIVALVTIFVTTNWFLPLLARSLTRCRLTYLSLSRIKGFEWRHELHASAIVPDIRLEHGSWRYGGWNRPEGVGFIVIYASGLSYRQRDRPRPKRTPAPERPRSRLSESLSPVTGPLSALAKQLVIGVPSLLIHHYPSLGGLLSFHISDGRIIFDDLDGLELTWKTLKLGAKVSFSKKEEAGLGQDGTSKEAIGRNSVSETIDENEPTWPASPPDSPVVGRQHQPFAFPPDHDIKDADTMSRPSRLSHARRQASAMSSRMTSTAAQTWGRIIGRAKGHAILTIEISDLAVILPHSNPAHLLSKPSIPDLVPQPHPQCDSNGLSHRLSSRSLNAQKVQNTYSMDRLFRSVPRYALPSHEGGYERLLALEGESTITTTMRFGKRRGWLAEDTLSLDTELGKLHTSLGAGTKVQTLMNKYNKEKRSKAGPDDASKDNSPDSQASRAEKRWSSDSKARIMLRAFQSVSISLSEVVVSHFLSVSNPSAGSANSSSSDLSSLASEDYFTISLNARALSIKINAADSSNNLRARNAFGTNAKRTSRVKGVGLSLAWDTIEVDSISPGDSHIDRNRLLAFQKADFEGFSSWRPLGWTRDELLFATDPNLALVVHRASIESIDAAGELKLLRELSDAWKTTHPRSAPSSPLPDEEDEPSVRLAQGLPPRLRFVLDIGRCTFALTERTHQQKITIKVATDKMHLGGFTSFSDRVGRRKDKLSMRNAFKEEEQLQQRRAELGDDIDYALPDAMLKPQLRRRFHHEQARLLEDLTMSMEFEGNFEMAPIAVHLSVQQADSGYREMYTIAKIGSMHGTASGNVLGRQVLDLVDTARIDPSTMTGSVGLGIEEGININLWEATVLDALVALGKTHTSTEAAPAFARPAKPDILSRLPSGLSYRFSLGAVSVFVGRTDPAPTTEDELVRGIWFKTVAVMEYAYYVNTAQTVRTRHDLTAPIRAKMRLAEDITTQALACYHHHAPTDGRAALFRLTLLETFATPIFNGHKFDQEGGTTMKYSDWEWPQAPFEPANYDSWEFIKPHGPTGADKGVFANAIPKFDESDTNKARRPLFRFKGASVKWTIQRKSPTADLEYRFTGRSEPIALVCGMPLIYCALLATTSLQRIADAWKRPSRTVNGEPKERPLVYLDYLIPSTTIHIAFPLLEQIFISFGHTHFSHEETRVIKFNMDQALVFVPSTNPREAGHWQELGVIKRLSVSKQTGEALSPINIGMDAFRIRIPIGYHVSKLVLNATSALKAFKLIRKDLRDGVFSTVQTPAAEQPKNVPPFVLSIGEVCIEAKDQPIEERLNLNWRVGQAEQAKRNELERVFDEKWRVIQLWDQLEEWEDAPEGLDPEDRPKVTRSYSEALYNLHMYNATNWKDRIKAAQAEHRRREETASNRIHSSSRNPKLPISVAAPALSAPLVRASFTNFKLSVKNPGMSRDEIIDYMGDVSSSPFDKDTEFSLMVPLQLGWEMGSAKIALRDYPLALINIRPLDDGSPAWELDTPFIIAEELHDDDSTMYVPCEIIPKGLGGEDVYPFTVQVFKTISPVKTYTRPHIKIHSKRTTEFAWGASMQPAIQDFMRVIETLSHPPRDPSPRVGFWDKFRLILHWVVKIDFDGPVHLHLKGSRDPYFVNGHGAGFALAWPKNTKVRINVPNEQGETIQISAEELLIAIPDLDALNDRAALGTQQNHDPERLAQAQEHDLISRRYTKPCARFMNGVRVGFGFAFERACRSHDCQAGCGSTQSYLHRLCRIFDFKRHQDVILRSPEAVMRDEKREQRPIDSYEGFRSDHVHFSTSLVSPLREIDPQHPAASTSHNSLHFTPKAFAHLYAWWDLFQHAMSLPIRQGRLFPDSPAPSKKFGQSLATIKYRFDLQSVYASHMYAQKARQLWDKGKTESLGLKARFGHFRADAHQRVQETIVTHKDTKISKAQTHKAFYALDLMLEDIELKGIRAEFDELPKHGMARQDSSDSISSSSTSTSDESVELVKASLMEPVNQAWFNIYDFFDSDRRPFDLDPKIALIDIGDCPEVFWSRRTKVRPATPYDEALQVKLSTRKPRRDFSNLYVQMYLSQKRRRVMRPMQRDGEDEDGNRYPEPSPADFAALKEEPDVPQPKSQPMSKFGDEDTHVCYMRENKSVAPIQTKITRARIRELQDKVKTLSHRPSASQQANIELYTHKLRILHDHIKKLEETETRDLVGDTFEHDHEHQDSEQGTEEPFQNVIHVHCPRLYLTNQSRNVGLQYMFSRHDRRKEEYHTGNVSVQDIKKNIDDRAEREAKSGNTEKAEAGEQADEALELLESLIMNLQRGNAESCFRLPVDHSADHAELHIPSLGIPEQFEVEAGYKVLLLKPQITLRSEADQDAIILLAVEELTSKTFHVLDPAAQGEKKDKNVRNGEVLDRYYVSMKGLQAFYPNAETLKRDQADNGSPRGIRRVPALPLEIFLDVRSEATDYDRIIFKTDAAIRVDKFNKLRITPTLNWPDAVDDLGEPIKHLKINMNKTTIIVPKITLSATSKHYSALYCIVTDLLMYQDPQHRDRSEQINNFMFQFDRKDRDPDQLYKDLKNLQKQIRHLGELIKGYEQHLDILDDEGRSSLLSIREHLFEATEQLSCVFEVISVNLAQEDARNAVKAASSIDIRAGHVAWHLLQDDLSALIQLDIDGTMMNILNNKDGSMDTACVVSDLSALNGNSDAILPEVAVRYETTVVSHGPRLPVASFVWSSVAPVGGIPVVRLLKVKVHPLRLQLEERVGRKIKDYIFNDRVARRREAASETTNRNDSSSQVGSKTTSNLELVPLNRSKSAVSVNSSVASSTGNRSVSTSGRRQGTGHDRVQNQFSSVPKGDAAEMRRRAKSTRFFHQIILEQTTFVVTYKRDETRKHKAFSMPNAVGIKIPTPRFAYAKREWTIENVYKQMQKDGISEMLLTTSLIGQVVRKTGVFRSNKSLKTLAKATTPGIKAAGLLGAPSSRLKFAVEQSTQMGDDDLGDASRTVSKESSPGFSHGYGVLGSPISKVVSRLSQSGHHSTPSSPSSGERISHLSKSPSTSMLQRGDRSASEPPDSMPSDEHDFDSEDERPNEGGTIGRKVKGLFGKLKHRRESPESASRRESNDDVSQFGGIGRP